MNRDARIEFIKLFIRIIEITFAGMVIAPTAAYVLGKEVSIAQYAVAMLIGLAVMLTAGVIAVTLSKRWKD
ncbi:MAG: hypothetical protein HYT87_13175 [Nitrospirae bacterium]|nr:hypothetical protein [Nitrospirota bacterium]